MIEAHEASSDAIEAAINSTQPNDLNPLTIQLCMDDVLTPIRVALLAQWCCRFKSLEGKKILSVVWEQGDKPYLRVLSILTE